MKSLLWKVLSAAATGAAVVGAKKVTDGTWQFTTGNPPPDNPEDPDVDWKEAIAWALLSGAVIGIARLVATRQAASFYAKQVGSTPAQVRAKQTPEFESRKKK